MPTASTVFLSALVDAGITHVFANWGSDHPGLLDALASRVGTSPEQQAGWEGRLEVITCPNEMAALSAAQGYTQVARRPAAVIVHVDVGTQALGGAVHNAAKGRAPILVYAGASPFSALGEHRGSRNEFIHWLQDVPDQPAIVRQYMKHVGELYSAKTTKRDVMRAIQIAMSAPQGPVYLWARREIMEEEVGSIHVSTPLNKTRWPPVAPAALAPLITKTIADALVTSAHPLIITAHLGRNPGAKDLLSKLSTILAIPVFQSCSSAVCIPPSHPFFVGTGYGTPPPAKLLQKADVILALDVDVPFIPTRASLPESSRVFVINEGPLERGFVWETEILARADPATALEQIIAEVERLRGDGRLDEARCAARADSIGSIQTHRSAQLAAAEAVTTPALTTPYLIAAVRTALQRHTPSHGTNIHVLNESVSNYPAVWEHLRALSMCTSGGSSLGWALGAAVGAGLANREMAEENRWEMAVVVVGDGSFLFGAPGAAYWMARRYSTPFLAIVLNNGGWSAPRLSMLGVHPEGPGSRVTRQDLGVSFEPESPDYGGLAVAGGKAWTRKIENVDAVNDALQEAIGVVLSGRCAVVDCVVME